MVKYFAYIIMATGAIIWLLFIIQEFKEDKQGTKYAFIAMIVIILIMITIVTVGNWLIDNHKEDILYTIICFLIFWIIWLYSEKSSIKKEYEQLKTFSYFYIYKQKQKILSYEDEDAFDYRYEELDEDIYIEYPESDYEDEFRKWKNKFEDYLEMKENQLGHKVNKKYAFERWLEEEN